ncbi:sulfur carrier protein ThiS [Nereida ignava]|jgi:sulfur carrier protein|uniref:Sulfur carrier protein ThiS n=1 Tax=Nereida ignava TaxID=282199 RepID=A0A0U1NLT9_9RHOB|nr:sulfur carrier protein ThiS [Nereida ignava]CRK75696.1 sulfur carrier protein ThiS [Nereida ignava]SFJ32052.1 sulfur carrier protein [Nereida ignava DSM 16309]
MLLNVNGEPTETDATTLADFLAKHGFEGAVVATAVNGAFVAKTARDNTQLAAGDQLEILAPMQGG